MIRLLQQSENLDLNRGRSNDKASALYLACFEGYIWIVKMLVEDNRTDINQETAEVTIELG